jgi:hypothetical protein
VYCIPDLRTHYRILSAQRYRKARDILWYYRSVFLTVSCPPLCCCCLCWSSSSLSDWRWVRCVIKQLTDFLFSFFFFGKNGAGPDDVAPLYIRVQTLHDRKIIMCVIMTQHINFFHSDRLRALIKVNGSIPYYCSRPRIIGSEHKMWMENQPREREIIFFLFTKFCLSFLFGETADTTQIHPINLLWFFFIHHKTVPYL